MPTQEEFDKAESDGWSMGYNDCMYENPYDKEIEPELWKTFDDAFWEAEHES